MRTIAASASAAKTSGTGVFGGVSKTTTGLESSYEVMLRMDPKGKFTLKAGLSFNPKENGSTSYSFYYYTGDRDMPTFRAGFTLPYIPVAGKQMPVVVAYPSLKRKKRIQADVICCDCGTLELRLLRCAAALEVFEATDAILQSEVPMKIKYNYELAEKREEILSLRDRQRQVERMELVAILEDIRMIPQPRKKSEMEQCAHDLLRGLPEEVELRVAGIIPK